MIKIRLLLVFLFALSLQACGLIFNVCGKSVELGEFQVLQESIVRWFPDRGAPEMVFVDSTNKEMTLTLEQDTSFMQVQTGKTICYEEAWDRSEEFIRNQWIRIVYSQGLNELKIEFISGWLDGYGEREIDKIFDQVHFSSLSDNVGAGVNLVAGDRGNDIDPNILPPPSYTEMVFADSIMINGKWYEDIWYFDRWFSDTLTLPTIYVKENIGILAFRDSNRNVWVKQSEY